MSLQSRRAERLDAIRSVSLEEIVNGRQRRWRMLLNRAKHAVLAASALALSLAAGSAAYFLASSPTEPVLLAAAPRAAQAAPAATDAPVTTGSISATRDEATPRPPQQRPEPVPLLASLAAEPKDAGPADVALARTPRPRPADEPVIVTGSVTGEELVVYGRVERRPPAFRPCRMLNQVAATLGIPRRCGS